MTEPTYPDAPPPQYPTAPPQYPTVPPQHPGPGPQQNPYAAAPPPQSPHVPPQGPTPPPAPPQQPQQPPALDPTVDIDPHTGRIHVANRQRGADAAAIGQLVLQLPLFLCSLIVVWIVSLFFDSPWNLVLLGAWLLSGALVFHRPTERLLARYLFRMRPALHSELDRLEPIWHQITAKAGVNPRTYDLWIEDHQSINATAAAGHIVAVTRYALDTLPAAQLAAVLAHELGHHRGGHAWAGLLGYWYSLPARLVRATVRRIASAFSFLGRFVLWMGWLAMVAVLALTFPPLLLLLVTPYLLAAVSRRAELRADLQAAELGFSEAMIQVFHGFLQQEEQARAAAAYFNRNHVARQSLAQRLLSTHPDAHTRIRHLEDWRAAAAGRGR